MANPFVHVELSTHDVPKAKAFYGKLFGWKLEDKDMGAAGTYTVINPEGGTGGGIMKHPHADAPAMWLAYVHVDDIEAATEKARSLGAKIDRPVTDIPGVGRFSIFTDPTGAMLALFTPKDR